MQAAFIFSLILGLLVPLAAAQQPPEPRGPRPEVIFGQGLHYITLTFYIDDASTMQEIVDILDEKNVTSAVFFVDPAIAANSSGVESARQ